MRYLLLLLVALLTIVPGIGQMPPVDRDEARFVQATKQMVESGDYVDIRFQEQSRYKKPVGIYWLQAAAVEASGYGAAAPVWIYRLASVLGILLGVLGTYWAGARLFGQKAGVISALVLAGIFGSAFEGRIGKTDAMLLGLTIIAQGALAQIYVSARRNEVSPAYLPWVFWIAQGCAILIKGPIAPLLSGLTIIALVIADRQWRWLARLRPLPGLGVAALIVLPWLAMITWKSGAAFWQESVGTDLAGKLTQGSESHWGPPGYYVLTYSLYFWPFGLLAIASGLLALRIGRGDPRIRFCLAWYIPMWLVLEVVGTKLPHYVLPAYPAVILLIGWAMTLSRDAAEAPFRRWETTLWYATAFGLAVVTVGLAALAIGAPIYLQGTLLGWSLPAAALVLLSGYLAFSQQVQLPVARIAGATAAAGGAYALMFGIVMPAIAPMWLSPQVEAAFVAQRPCPTSTLASSRFHEPSLVFLVGTKTVLTDTAGAAGHLLADPSCGMALIPSDEDAAFQALLVAGGIAAQPVASFDGLNYSSGDSLSLTLYRGVK
jgi:4-amino-4-deoxy-L-arabinose transferase-like glycosyltransferase